MCACLQQLFARKDFSSACAPEQETGRKLKEPPLRARLPVTPVYVLPSDAGRAFFLGASVAQALPPEKKFAGHVTFVAAQKEIATQTHVYVRVRVRVRV